MRRVMPVLRRARSLKKRRPAEPKVNRLASNVWVAKAKKLTVTPYPSVNDGSTVTNVTLQDSRRADSATQ
jgi:hypothetical protein